MQEIEEERMESFLSSLLPPKTGLLKALREQAQAERVPIIREEAEALLTFLILQQKPRRVLEVGTAVGYSAIVMCSGMPPEGKITTIENYEKRILQARENFKKAGMEEKITLLEGDATLLLPKLEGPYDLIFMDAAKGQYGQWLPDVLRLLAPGGTLVSDNILQEGELLSSRFAVSRRNRTIHSRMREYMYTLTHAEQLHTVLLPVGDGMSLTVKKEE